MIIIYNISGLLLGIVGIVVGFIVFVLTGWLAPGLFMLVVVWFAGGVWWHKREVTPGVRTPYPSLFFVPLPFLAVPVALLAMPILLIEWSGGGKPADPRADLFHADVRLLDSGSATGDAQLSEAILAVLQTVAAQEAKAERFHVFTRESADSVLVLVKIPNLKDYTEQARKQLLDTIAKIVGLNRKLKTKRMFIGIKGQVTFGAIRVSPNFVQTGSFVTQSKLHDFYGEQKRN